MVLGLNRISARSTPAGTAYMSIVWAQVGYGAGRVATFLYLITLSLAHTWTPSASCSRLVLVEILKVYSSD